MVANALSNSHFVIPESSPRSSADFDKEFAEIASANPDMYEVMPTTEQAHADVLRHYGTAERPPESIVAWPTVEQPLVVEPTYLDAIQSAAYVAEGHAKTTEAMRRPESEVRPFTTEEIARAAAWIDYLRKAMTELPENHPTAAAIPNKAPSRFSLKKLSRLFTGPGLDNITEVPHLTIRQLIEHESEIGRGLFPDKPAGEHWEFFTLDPMTWVWSRAPRDKKDPTPTKIIRYEIHQNGILKVTNGSDYRYLDAEEMRNFGMTVHLYYNEVMRGIYKRNPQTGEPLEDKPVQGDFALAA